MDNIKPKTTSKDFFLWAGAMIALYISIFSYVSLVFNYIDFAFPNVLQNYYSYSDPYQSGISYEMASLIVMFPIFFALMWLIHCDIKLDTTRREVWIRRWALMLTLFLAILTAAIDLIVLITSFLSGEALTAAFLLKVALVFLVAAGVFMHFIADFWGNWEKYPERAHRIGYATTFLVVITIIAGFFIVGTPQQARQMRLDAQRVSDLQSIQSQIVSYWQQKGSLPAQLSDLSDSLSYFTVPVDPETNQNYTYKRNSPLDFSLCATFDRVNLSSYSSASVPAIYGDTSDKWTHDAGNVCFDRSIDPQLYPVNKTAATQ